jgi:geranyl-CoA carboxylase beta subunit
MGGEQAAKVLSIVTEGAAKRSGKPVDQTALAEREKKIIDQFDRESTALYATARLWDDGLIDPRDTREVLGLCLACCHDAARIKLNPSSFGVARM